jgi:prevent-host-death family protein
MSLWPELSGRRSAMTTVGIQEFKDHMRRYLAAAKRGEDVVVTENGKPLARITKPSTAEFEESECLARLAAEGHLRPALKRRRPAGPPPLDVPGGALSELIIEDRR